jgi:Ca-activated chloride channel family protein
MEEINNLALLRFQNTEILWATLIIPILFLGYFFNRKRKLIQLQKFGDLELIEKLTPDASKTRPLLKFSLYNAALLMLIFSLARPQAGSEIEVDTGDGRQIVIALDVSNSMMAEDIKPNRLEKAKLLIADILRKNAKDRTALVVFAGEAYIQIPLSSNFHNPDLFLSAINPNMIPVQGTNIADAIDLSINVFDKTTDEGKIIIILSDGENHENESIEKAKNAADLGIIISTIGMGKQSAVPIPEENGEYKKDRNGNIVLTKLNPTLLTDVANAGNGMYFSAGNISSDLRNIQKQLDKVDTADSKIEMKKYKDLFYIFIFAAMLFLLIDFMLLERKNKRLSKINLFD